MANQAQRAAADLLNNPTLDQMSKDMSDFDKLLFTLALAVGATIAFGVIGTLLLFLILAIITGFGVAQFFFALTTSFSFFGWLFLVNGTYKDGELERSTGTVGGQFTSWILSTGRSWWIPRLIGGGTVRKINIEIRKLNRTRDGGNPLSGVVTYDGAEVGVEYFDQYKVVDEVKAREYDDIDGAYAALKDRHARFFANEWDGDPATSKSLARRKSSFSNWMSGRDVVKDRDGDDVVNTIVADAAEMGIEMVSSRITDINPPPDLVQARKDKIREKAEAEKELANITARRRQAMRLKHGGKNDESLDISDDRALQAAELAANDRTIIQVDGSAEDFTKGQLGAAVFQSRRQKQGDSKT